MATRKVGRARERGASHTMQSVAAPCPLFTTIAKQRDLSREMATDAAVCEYALKFSAEAFKKSEQLEQLIELVASTLKFAHVRVRKEFPEGETPFLVCHVDDHALDVEGEHLKYLKQRKDTGNRDEFIVEEGEQFEAFGDKSFWLPCEKAQLTLSVLESVPVPKTNLEPFLRGLTPKRREAALALPSLVHALKLAEMVEVVMPLHELKGRKFVWAQALRRVLAPVHEIHAYFGSRVAYYFAWMNYFTTSLLAPAVFGTSIYFHKLHYGYTVDNHPWLPFFSLFMVFWAINFVHSWKRKSKEWACMWGTLNDVEKEDVRAEFHGELVKSPVTGKLVRYYPPAKRTASYLVSFVVTSAFLAVAFFIMICSLNLQGYIKDGGLWTERVFFIPFLAKWSDPGRIFDPEAMTNLIPVVLHVITIMQLNSLYQTTAHWLTDEENPRTNLQYDNSVILKRFLFESFDCYIALFYLAFFQFDVIRLRTELVGMYTTDSLRRVFLETLVPFATSWVTERGREKAAKKLADATSKKSDIDDMHAAEAFRQFQLPEYEQFDDYLEMVIEFGYITMFASSFPLAAGLSVLCNLVELKSDCFKITHVTQRPHAVRAQDIGVWENILEAQAYLAVLTNVLLFAFTSEQMRVWFPDLFGGSAGDGTDAARAGAGRFVVAICFGIEHIIILSAMAVQALIPPEPEWVSNEQKRLLYEKEVASRDFRHEQLMRHSSLGNMGSVPAASEGKVSPAAASRRSSPAKQKAIPTKPAR